MNFLSMKYFAFLLFIIAFVGNGFAQNRPTEAAIQCAITGFVWTITENDSIGGALPDANIRLLNASDSSLVKGALSDSTGKFVLPGIMQGNYILVVSFTGFATSYTHITSNRFRRNEMIDLGKIVLQEGNISLGAVVVEAQIPEMVIRGDTIEYNPDAFKVQEGAVVEDLLKKLPGIEVSADGKITVASGKTVSRVLINGKDFFENDPKIATKNITVDIVDKVQVIEKKTEQSIRTGIDDGEKETIINLTIKPNRLKGWMGNVTTGAGTLVDKFLSDGSRYNFQSMLNNFNEKRQTSIFTNANNTSSGMGGGMGITKSNAAGLNFSASPNEKWRTSGSVSYNFSDNTSERNSFRTNLLVDSMSYRRSSSNSNNSSHNLNFNARMEYKPDSLLTVSFSPQVSFNFADSQNQSFEETLAGDRDSTLVNRSASNSKSNTNGMNMSGNLSLSRLFSKKGRRISLLLNGSLNQNTINGANLSYNEFFLFPDRNKTLNQESVTTSNSNSYGINASYVEPVRKNVNLALSYNFRSNGTLNLRKTFDYDDIDDTFSILNTDYSKSLKNQFVSQSLGLSLNASNTKYTYNVGLTVLPSSTKSTSFIKDGISEGVDSILNNIKERKVINYSPRINYSYRFNQQTNLSFTYSGSTRQPSVSQLDPTPDNTNPLNIRSGNPDLLPAFSNSTSLRFSSYQREKQRTLSLSADYGFTINEIISFTDYEQGTGVQYTRPINENGTWSTGGNVMFNMPLGKKKRVRLNINSRINYNNRVGFSTINSRSHRNVSGSLSISENLGLSYNKDWFTGSLNASMSHSNTTYSLESRQGQRNSYYNVSFNTFLKLPKHFQFNTDVNYNAQRGLASGYNKNEVLWNMECSKQFLKGNAGMLRLSWTDILQKRQYISRNITANYIEDYAYNSLTSYIFATFSYRFNKIGK